MKTNLTALAAGLLFGGGLAVSQMVNPAKVLGFLDVAGSWDPSLILVLASALGLTALAFRFILKRPGSVWGGDFRLSETKDIDRRLVGGAVLFGIGWGLIGFCPGPAIAALAYGSQEAAIFVIAMLIGFFLEQSYEKIAGPQPG